MEKGRHDWEMAFCMSLGGNPVCVPEPWRSKSSPQWKYFKNHGVRGEYVQVHSDSVTYTMMRDSSVLRIADNDVPLSEEQRVVKVWNKEKKIWGGYRRIIAPMAVHFYKSFYGVVDVHNGLRARYGLDWSTHRKMFRVSFSMKCYKFFIF